MKAGSENPAVERAAAETILQRGVKFKIAAPWYIRWLKKTITLQVKSPYYGTLMRVSYHYLGTGLKEHQLSDVTIEQSLALMHVHGKALSKAVAAAVLNGKWKCRLFTRPLAHYLRWNLTPKEMSALVSTLLVFGGTADFMTTTRSVRMMRHTAPKTGRTAQGS